MHENLSTGYNFDYYLKITLLTKSLNSTVCWAVKLMHFNCGCLPPPGDVLSFPVYMPSCRVYRISIALKTKAQMMGQQNY